MFANEWNQQKDLEMAKLCNVHQSHIFGVSSRVGVFITSDSFMYEVIGVVGL